MRWSPEGGSAPLLMSAAMGDASIKVFIKESIHPSIHPSAIQHPSSPLLPLYRFLPAAYRYGTPGLWEKAVGPYTKSEAITTHV